MTLNIKSPKADKLARELSDRTGENITEAVIKALEERLERTQSKYSPDLKEALTEIAKRCAKLPDLDPRSPEEILGYDKFGLPR
jgi:antitoxin VapB